MVYFGGGLYVGGRGLFWCDMVGVACDVLPGPAGVVWVLRRCDNK